MVIVSLLNASSRGSVDVCQKGGYYFMSSLAKRAYLFILCVSLFVSVLGEDTLTETMWVAAKRLLYVIHNKCVCTPKSFFNQLDSCLNRIPG